jgi:phosphatidate cytidylyltransferase
VVAIPAVLGVVLAGGAPLAALLAIAAAIAAWEYYRMAAVGGSTPLADLGIAAAGLVPLAVHAHYLGVWTPGLVWIVLFPIGVFTTAIWTRGPAGRPLSGVAVTLFGVVYTGGALSFGYAIRSHPYAFAEAKVGGFAVASGALLLMLPLLVTWTSDIAAYAFGRAFGKRKLIPSVSPGKTVAGAVGGLLAAMAMAWVYTAFVLTPVAQLGFRGRALGAIAFGLVVGAAAQIGDLAESLLKREAGVKDSSSLLPGHGGVLDRLDSLFFVLPVSFALMHWLLTWAAP